MTELVGLDPGDNRTGYESFYDVEQLPFGHNRRIDNHLIVTPRETGNAVVGDGAFQCIHHKRLL